MDKNIQQILNELYEIDPGLKVQELQLIEIIQNMMRIKPHISIDNNFKQHLSNIMKSKIKKDSFPHSPYNWFHIFSYIFGTVGIAAFSGIFFYQNFLGNSIQIPTQTEITSGTNTGLFQKEISGINKDSQSPAGTNIQNTNDIQQNKTSISSDIIAQTPSISPLSEPLSDSINNGEDAGIMNDTSSETMMKMTSLLPPQTQEILYNYSGVLDIPTSLPVYKMQTSEKIFPEITAFLNSVAQDNISLKTFSDLNINSLTLHEKNQSGYIITLDENTLSIYKNGNNETNEIITHMPLSQEDIFKIAGDFIQTHNISLSGYGSGEIIQDGNTRFTTLLYPRIINNTTIYEEYSTNKEGVRIEINNQTQQVNGLYNLSLNGYSEQYYTTEQKSTKLLDDLQKKYNGGSGGNNDADKINISLSNPRIIYIKTIKNIDQIQQSVLIPVLEFTPVGTKDSSIYIPNSVYVEIIPQY